MRKIFDRIRSYVFKQAPEIEPVEVRNQEIFFRCDRELVGGEQRLKLPSGEVLVKVTAQRGDIYSGLLVTRYGVSKSQKRRPRRFPVNFSVDSHAFSEGIADNASISGLKLTVDRELKVNEEVEMRITCPDTVSKINIKSVCVWCRPGSGGRYEAGFHIPNMLEWERSWLKRRCLEAFRPEFF